MASLVLQKRLAMDLLKCGHRKVWLDPAKKHIIAQARSRTPPLLFTLSRLARPPVST